MDCLPPAAIADAAAAVGQKKTSLSTPQLVVLGTLAGAYIGFGGQLFSLVTSDLSQHAGFGLSRIIGGIAFSIGLILVVLGGAELFTGNNLLAIAALTGRVSWRSVLRNWFWVYLSNLVGAVLLALLLFEARQYTMNGGLAGVNALAIAVAKVNLHFWTAFFRGVLCNWLVCLAVWMAMGATDTAGKILAVIPPIAAFVASGFEHSVADMFFIPMGLLVKTVPSVVELAGPLAGLDKLTWGTGLFVRSLLPVTMGNMAGGVLFVALLYWVAYLCPTCRKEPPEVP